MTWDVLDRCLSLSPVEVTSKDLGWKPGQRGDQGTGGPYFLWTYAHTEWHRDKAGLWQTDHPEPHLGLSPCSDSQPPHLSGPSPLLPSPTYSKNLPSLLAPCHTNFSWSSSEHLLRLSTEV